ncbi:MAG: pilus assembly FimT family protein [Longimicrobiales bacterium]
MGFVPQLRRPGRRPGFTLYETLIVAALMGIIFAVALPQVFTSMRNTQADKAAFVVVSDLESAFSLAARQRAPVTFTVDGSAMRYMIRNKATSALLVERYLSASTSPYGVTSLTMSVGTLTLFPNGMASGPTIITLSVANENRTVRLTRAGQIRMGS